MDVHKVIDEVAARTQIRIDKDDPAFAMATLIDVSCEKSLERMQSRLEAALVEYERSALKLQGRIAAMLVKEVWEKLAVAKKNPESAATPGVSWIGLPVAYVVLVFLAGFLVGVSAALCVW